MKERICLWKLGKDDDGIMHRADLAEVVEERRRREIKVEVTEAMRQCALI